MSTRFTNYIYAQDDGGNQEVHAALHGANDATQIYSWMVSLANSDVDNNQKFCGGTLINVRWVITAKHCFSEGALDSNSTYAFIAKRDLRNSSEGEVIKVLAHAFLEDYDLALLYLQQPSTQTPITFADEGFMQTFVLPNSSLQAKLLGWGSGEQGIYNPVLQELNVPLVPNEVCGLSRENLCYGFRFYEEHPDLNKGACRGDSGGPLIIADTLVGVHIQHEGKENCSRGYLAAIRVASFNSWIRAILYQQCPNGMVSASVQSCNPSNDTTPPTVNSFQASISGANAQLRVSNLSDNATGIAEVHYSAKWDGVWKSVGNVTQSPFSLDWNMCNSSIPDGLIEFGLEVVDGAGNKYIWSQHHNNPTAYKAFNCNPDGGNTTGLAKLYALSNYGGATVWSGGTGFSNSPKADSYAMQLPSGWSAKTWRGDNRSGEERCWSSSVNNLQDHGWQLAIQSIEVFDSNICGTGGSSDVVTMCADSACWNFVVGYYSLPAFGMNDSLTKIIGVPANRSVMLYREGGLRGTVECFNDPRDPLPQGGAFDLWKQSTDVVVFNGKNCPLDQQPAVIFYNDQNYGGYYWAAGSKSGVFNMSDLGSQDLFNDTAQSMKIPPTKSAMLYEHDSGQGQASSCFTGEIVDFGTLSNKVSSVRIFDNTSCAPDAPIDLAVTETTYHSISFTIKRRPDQPEPLNQIYLPLIRK